MFGGWRIRRCTSSGGLAAKWLHLYVCDDGWFVSTPVMGAIAAALLALLLVAVLLVRSRRISKVETADAYVVIEEEAGRAPSPLPVSNMPADYRSSGNVVAAQPPMPAATSLQPPSTPPVKHNQLVAGFGSWFSRGAVDAAAAGAAATGAGAPAVEAAPRTQVPFQQQPQRRQHGEEHARLNAESSWLATGLVSWLSGVTTMPASAEGVSAQPLWEESSSSGLVLLDVLRPTPIPTPIPTHFTGEACVCRW